MTKNFVRTLAGLAAGLLLSVSAFANEGGNLMHAGTDLGDRASLQRGAALYMNYCSGCHSLKYMRYSRMAEDLGLSEEDLTAGKSQLKGQITLSLESPTSRMYRAAGVELYGEPYRTLDEVLALIDAIDAETCAAICRMYYAPARQTLLSLGPRAAA